MTFLARFGRKARRRSRKRSAPDTSAAEIAPAPSSKLTVLVPQKLRTPKRILTIDRRTSAIVTPKKQLSSCPAMKAASLEPEVESRAPVVPKIHEKSITAPELVSPPLLQTQTRSNHIPPQIPHQCSGFEHLLGPYDENEVERVPEPAPQPKRAPQPTLLPQTPRSTEKRRRHPETPETLIESREEPLRPPPRDDSGLTFASNSDLRSSVSTQLTEITQVDDGLTEWGLPKALVPAEEDNDDDEVLGSIDNDEDLEEFFSLMSEIDEPVAPRQPSQQQKRVASLLTVVYIAIVLRRSHSSPRSAKDLMSLVRSRTLGTVPVSSPEEPLPFSMYMPFWI